MTTKDHSSLLSNPQLSINDPTVCVVGSGFSGLLTAIYLKEREPSIQVLVIEKKRPENNTQIAGMRIRARKAGSNARTKEEEVDEVVKLLAQRNEDVETEPMRLFGKMLCEELDFWNNRLTAMNPGLVSEHSTWFGPQWGVANKSGKGGRGLNVLGTLREIAKKSGVQFIDGEVNRLIRFNDRISAVGFSREGRQYQLESDLAVLANGNAAGKIFCSTNKAVNLSATELLFDAGLPLDGGSLVMWHPFGNCNSSGQPLLGCHETDNLAGTQVFFMDGTQDHVSTKLLQEHQAHYHFKEIATRFLEHGGVVRLVFPNGEEKYARVSLHYSQLGAQTVDGSRVKGMENLYVTGDAGGLSYWTNHRVRLPGYALAHCIVSARVASNRIIDELRSGKISIEGGGRITDMGVNNLPQAIPSELEQIREINTKYLLQLEFGGELAESIIHSWKDELASVGGGLIGELSLSITNCWNKILQGEEEPISVIRESSGVVDAELLPSWLANSPARRL